MIEMGKKYRTVDPRWEKPEIYEVGDSYSYGRVGFYPISWSTHHGVVERCPHGLESVVDSLALVEVLPEVTVRKAVVACSDGGVGMYDFALGPCLGAIDITHNGKEIVKVEVVK